MAYPLKLIFAKITIVITLISLIGMTVYLSKEYSLDRSFQLATLAALGVFIALAIALYLLYHLIHMIYSKFTVTYEDDELEEPEPYVVPKEERIIRHNSKEEYEKSRQERMNGYDNSHHDLMEMLQEQGSVGEVMLILPLDLSFLLAKESILDLFWGKISEQSEESGTITGSAGFGSSPQEIIISVQPITKHSSKITIISRSLNKKQSEIKNVSYIKKISDFFRKKEKFYAE